MRIADNFILILLYQLIKSNQPKFFFDLIGTIFRF